MMKKILSLLLAATLIFLTLTIPAGAKSEAAQPTAAVAPVIMIRGMLFDGLTVDAGTPNERNAFAGIDVGALVRSLMKAGVKLITKGKTAAVSELCAYAKVVLGGFACDKNGDSVYDVTVPQYPLSLDHYDDPTLTEGTEREEGLAHAVMDTVGAENSYYVYYDWRKSQLDVADEINAIVNQALADHPQFDKVIIISASMGGAETVAYLTKYGYSKVQRCIFLSSTFCATYVAGDSLTGHIQVTPDGLCNFVSYHAPAAAKVMKALNKLGVLKVVCKYLQQFIDNNKRQVYDEFMTDTFGTMPGLWGVTQTDQYEEAKAYLFGDRIDEYAGLIRRTDELQKMVANAPAMLKQMQADGVETIVVASYNSPLAPVYERSCANGDNTLETALMCGGAVVADLGETLGDDYVPANPEKLSPDRVADLSGVLFPEHTWLVKDAPHVGCRYGSEHMAFVLWLITSPEAPDVHANPKYPQFMAADADQNLSPMK